jgi:hypothetical protein
MCITPHHLGGEQFVGQLEQPVFGCLSSAWLVNHRQFAISQGQNGAQLEQGSQCPCQAAGPPSLDQIVDRVQRDQHMQPLLYVVEHFQDLLFGCARVRCASCHHHQYPLAERQAE